MNYLFRLIGKGILTLLPVIILIWILQFVYTIISNIISIIFNTTDNSISATLTIIVLMLAILAYAGLLFERNKDFILLKIGEFIISKIPGISPVYGTIKDVVKMFSGGGSENYLGVCYVEFNGSEVIGFITKEEGEFFWVFVPTTPNPTGGILFRLKADKVKKSDMSVADGLKKVISLGIK